MGVVGVGLQQNRSVIVPKYNVKVHVAFVKAIEADDACDAEDKGLALFDEQRKMISFDREYGDVEVEECE
jgi:hypothetical protein